MTRNLLIIIASFGLLTACDDKGGGDTGGEEGDADADADSDSDTDADVAGDMVTAWWDGSVIDDYAVVGSTFSCPECVYAFDGDFVGSVSDFSASVYVVAGNGYVWVYADVGGSYHVWGYGYDSGGVTEFGNYGLYYYYPDYYPYYYGGYFTH